MTDSIRIEIDETGTYRIDGREVFVVDVETSTDQNGDSWLTENEHRDMLDDAVEQALHEQRVELIRDFEDDRREAERLFDGLVELVGHDVIRESARRELRSTPIKTELSRRGVL